MDQTAAARLLSMEDVVLEILHRVSADHAALFRCSVACKRWRALIADRSFLHRCWPGNASSLLGFFHWKHIHADRRMSYRVFFEPPTAGSVLGTHGRLLSSIVHGLPDDNSYFAKPLAARHGILLMRFISGIHNHESLQIAVCDLFARRCHILPLLELRSSFVGCTILNGAECGQHKRSLNYFKVLVVVFFNNPKNKDIKEFHIYTFTSTEAQWSAPTNYYESCKRSFWCAQISNDNIVSSGNAYWLISSFDDNKSLKYSTLTVRVHTGQTSLMDLPFLSSTNDFDGRPTLGATADGTLMLFRVQKEVHSLRLHIWKHINSDVWLYTRAIELNLTRRPNHHGGVHVMMVEKSFTMFIIDEYGCVHKINVETGTVEEQQFENALNLSAVPMNIEWSTLFASRLGLVLVP